MMSDQLDLYLANERLKSFSWGAENGDCLLFLAGWGERLGGHGIGAKWRGRYSSEDEARGLLASCGGAVAACCDAFGAPRMGSVAIRGDVGLMEIDGWHLGIICTGRMWAMRVKDRGIGYVRGAPDLVWPMGFQA